MFGFRSKDALWQARIDDLKHEHNRTVDALVAWIEQLQGQIGAFQQPVAVGGQYPQAGAMPQPDAVPMSMYVSDEEEGLNDALALKLITQEQYDEELARINAADSIVG